MVRPRDGQNIPDLQPRYEEIEMLIPENNKWRWNDGPLCDTKEEALATAKEVEVKDSVGQVYFVDHAEVMEIEE